jgi:hypothetical protein
MMKGDQFGKFEADLKKHGLQNPVVLFEGKILDGRNRALVAHKLGWKIKTVKFEDLKTEKSALEYVLSANLHRRHLSDHERVQIAADFAEVLIREKERRTAADQAFSDVGQTNKSGAIASLAEVGGRGKKGPAAITATQLGVDKSNVTRELQRRKNANQRKTEVLARVPPEQHEKLFSLAIKNDSSPGSAADFERAEKALAANPNATLDDVRPHRTKHSSPAQSIDRDRLNTQLYNAVLGTGEYQQIRRALEQNTWKLSDAQLVNLSLLGHRLLKKILPCLLYSVAHDIELPFEPSYGIPD